MWPRESLAASIQDCATANGAPTRVSQCSRSLSACPWVGRYSVAAVNNTRNDLKKITQGTFSHIWTKKLQLKCLSTKPSLEHACRTETYKFHMKRSPFPCFYGSVGDVPTYIFAYIQKKVCTERMYKKHRLQGSKSQKEKRKTKAM